MGEAHVTMTLNLTHISLVLFSFFNRKSSYTSGCKTLTICPNDGLTKRKSWFYYVLHPARVHINWILKLEFVKIKKLESG